MTFFVWAIGRPTFYDWVSGWSITFILLVKQRFLLKCIYECLEILAFLILLAVAKSCCTQLSITITAGWYLSAILGPVFLKAHPLGPPKLHWKGYIAVCTTVLRQLTGVPFSLIKAPTVIIFTLRHLSKITNLFSETSPGLVYSSRSGC